METNGRHKYGLATIAVATLVALTIVPALAATASAASVGPAATPALSGSGSWAYGGEASGTFGLKVGAIHYDLDAAAGLDVVYNSTNTSANTTELTATRTVVVTISETFSGPRANWAYQFKLAEDDVAIANVTDLATVTLANGSVVPALGLLNASLHANVTLAASLVGTTANGSMSDYLNASGYANAHVVLAPALGLVPLNLTNVTSWSASAMATGSADWNISWSWVDHGWNGTSASHSGSIAGTWSAATEVTLYGHVGHPYAGWHDHRARTAVEIGLTGPFDLYAGFLLVPHGFDLFGGGSSTLGAAGLGSGAATSEGVFLNHAGHVTARSVTAGNLSAGASAPYGASVALATGAAPTVASSPGTTVWAQPMSPSAAKSQASCLQYGTGCASTPRSLGGLIVLLGIAGVAAVVGTVLVLSRRGRGGKPAPTSVDTPLAVTPPTTPMPPTPPTGVVPASGPVSPFP
ncbi:MAG TPA: hypothetical protein VMH49_04040 [Thermoplasmata archaeon]|nr:hypothetical protein [Thermoplasmata archaeon]